MVTLVLGVLGWITVIMKFVVFKNESYYRKEWERVFFRSKSTYENGLPLCWEFWISRGPVDNWAQMIRRHELILPESELDLTNLIQISSDQWHMNKYLITSSPIKKTLICQFLWSKTLPPWPILSYQCNAPECRVGNRCTQSNPAGSSAPLFGQSQAKQCLVR